MQLLENNLTRLNYNGEREREMRERKDEKWMLFTTKYSRGKITVDGLNRYGIPTQ